MKGRSVTTPYHQYKHQTITALLSTCTVRMMEEQIDNVCYFVESSRCNERLIKAVYTFTAFFIYLTKV